MYGSTISIRVYDASHEKIGQEDIENRKEMYGDNLTDAQLDQLETICDKIKAAQYHTIWYRALQLDQSEDGRKSSKRNDGSVLE